MTRREMLIKRLKKLRRTLQDAVYAGHYDAAEWLEEAIDDVVTQLATFEDLDEEVEEGAK